LDTVTADPLIDITLGVNGGGELLVEVCLSQIWADALDIFLSENLYALTIIVVPVRNKLAAEMPTMLSICMAWAQGMVPGGVFPQELWHQLRARSQYTSQ